MAGEKVAVVGGTGFLGSHIVLQLLKAGYAPVVVARDPDKAAKVFPGIGVETRQGDVTDLNSLRVAFQGCTYVHSVAALLNQVYTGATRLQEDEVVRTNVEGTLNVLRAAQEHGVKRTILTGSCGTRYTRGGTVANEDSPPTDLRLVNDPYVRSKLRSERSASEFARQKGMQVVHILPGALIGPGDWGPGPLGEGVVERLNGVHKPSIDGGFPAVDVRDAAWAHVRAMVVEPVRPSYMVVAETVSSRYWGELVTRFGGTSPLTGFLSPRTAMAFARLAEVVARIRRKAPAFTRNSVQHLAQNQKCDSSRAQRELGVTFTPIETSARDMIQWYLDHGFVSPREAETHRPPG